MARPKKNKSVLPTQKHLLLSNHDVLNQILGYILFPSNEQSASQLMTCKAFYLVGTPYLYETVNLRTVASLNVFFGAKFEWKVLVQEDGSLLGIRRLVAGAKNRQFHREGYNHVSIPACYRLFPHRSGSEISHTVPLFFYTPVSLQVKSLHFLFEWNRKTDRRMALKWSSTPPLTLQASPSSPLLLPKLQHLEVGRSFVEPDEFATLFILLGDYSPPSIELWSPISSPFESETPAASTGYFCNTTRMIFRSFNPSLEILLPIQSQHWTNFQKSWVSAEKYSGAVQAMAVNPIVQTLIIRQFSEYDCSSPRQSVKSHMKISLSVIVEKYPNLESLVLPFAEAPASSWGKAGRELAEEIPGLGKILRYEE